MIGIKAAVKSNTDGANAAAKSDADVTVADADSSLTALAQSNTDETKAAVMSDADGAAKDDRDKSCSEA